MTISLSGSSWQEVLKRTSRAAYSVVLVLYVQISAAQPYLAKPVRVIVPFAPGGGGDLTARAVSEKVSEKLKQQFVVDNRGGAGGLVGLELTAKSLSDGYPIMIMFGAFGDARGQRTFRNAGDVGAELAHDR